MSSSRTIQPTLPSIVPDWPAAPRVRAVFTLRTGGVSKAPYDSLNLGLHVGDDTTAVLENRRRVREALYLPSEPVWSEQVHGTEVIDLDDDCISPGTPIGALSTGSATTNGVAPTNTVPVGDAAMTRKVGRVCAIQVADCLPVLFAMADGSAVAAAHAGWRGLAGGVLENTVRALRSGRGASIEIHAWMGPAIGKGAFEVGGEVRDAFVSHDPGASECFSSNSRGRWQCDLVGLARRRLLAAGIDRVSGGSWCTYSDPGRFFSYRRDGRCGRMAALVWLEPG